MKQTNTHPLIADYLDQVCRHVRATEMHRRIRDELESHLLDLMDEQMDEGVEEEEAVRQAILQMGDSATIGKQLHRIYKPKVEWRLLVYVMAFLAVGLFTMYGMQVSFIEFKLDRYWFYTLFGIGVMLAVTFTDYRKLLPYSLYLYVLTVVVLLIVLVQDYTINGESYLHISRSITIDFAAMSTYFFLISVAGMILTRTWRFRGTASKLIVFVLLPASLFLIAGSHKNLMLYLFGFVIIMMYAKTARKEKLFLVTASTVAGIAAFLLDSFPLERFLLGWLQPTKDALGWGYYYLELMEVLRTAGLWGKGFQAPLPNMPYLDSDFKFTYLIYRYGWFGGIIILLAVTLFMMRLARVVKEVDEPYGKHLIVSIVPLFSVYFFWPLLMSTGLLPIVTLGIPFLSYTNIGTALAHFTALGLILSVHRHKNSIGKPHTYMAK
ncbi:MULTISPECIES: FtsW/RodA/SpoVE family cell cycle protein [Brevibacillus]|uniref:FtsW/RodA/SpoVE family cell cycle protein n=1 Tax=Brevibacillus brevis TaxID=1393 RepID=A0A2Z4MES7_BREBE|nr:MULTISPECIES: FtsW/RodA/SpoVE family cell cycle protein [Brevibacillus]AWX54954.1 FtsW/RodA/SpoVE family cell cycle protein [Brevibacillus brevis]NRR22532.1 FtsW/RodA/SpoVE family cell cycle protein [Brevibacillus sp. MS2.2]